MAAVIRYSRKLLSEAGAKQIVVVELNVAIRVLGRKCSTWLSSIAIRLSQ